MVSSIAHRMLLKRIVAQRSVRTRRRPLLAHQPPATNTCCGRLCNHMKYPVKVLAAKKKYHEKLDHQYEGVRVPNNHTTTSNTQLPRSSCLLLVTQRDRLYLLWQQTKLETCREKLGEALEHHTTHLVAMTLVILDLLCVICEVRTTHQARSRPPKQQSTPQNKSNSAQPPSCTLFRNSSCCSTCARLRTWASAP